MPKYVSADAVQAAEQQAIGDASDAGASAIEIATHAFIAKLEAIMNMENPFAKVADATDSSESAVPPYESGEVPS